MPGYAAPTGKFEAHDNNGRPLAGGQVWTYQAGTSAPATTYATSTVTGVGAVPNPNPVILDASGRADIWIPDASVMTYKWVVKNAAGVLQYTADGVSGAPTPGSGGGGGGTSTDTVPVGAILAWGGTAPPLVPAGKYLLCNGAEVDQGTYPALFGVIQRAFGPGNNSSTFNLPDLRGRSPLGLPVSGGYATLGFKAGSLDHRHDAPAHTHDIAAHSHPMSHTHVVRHDGWPQAGQQNPSPGPGYLLVSVGEPYSNNANNVHPGEPSSITDTYPNTVGTTTSGIKETPLPKTGPENSPFQVVNFIIRALP